DPDADQQAKLDQFHAHLQTVFANAADVAEEDGGEASILDVADPKDAYAKISGALGSAPEGGDEQGIGDIFGKVRNGAKDALRGASCLEMKKRAGVVGSKGLGPLLAALHGPSQSPNTRVHLMGHSFGARLVSYALSSLPSGAGSPVAS